MKLGEGVKFSTGIGLIHKNSLFSRILIWVWISDVDLGYNWSIVCYRVVVIFRIGNYRVDKIMLVW